MVAPDFRRLMTIGRAAVLSGRHATEGLPSETGRWGPSIVLLPKGSMAAALAQLTREAVELLGDEHWPSGDLGRAHITVRALEPHAEAIPPHRADRYAAAVARALRGVGAMGLELTGVGLTPGGIVVRATSIDGAADRLRARLEEELGDDGWLERTVFDNGRNPIWYSTIVHFAAPLSGPRELVAWADERVDSNLGVDTFESVALCTWAFDGRAMTPQTIRTVSADRAGTDGGG